MLCSHRPACNTSTSAHPRLIGFGACLLGAAVCFFVAFLTAPLIPIRPAKFALALRSAHIPPRLRPQPSSHTLLCSSLGSLLVMFGFVVHCVRVFTFLSAHEVGLPQLRRLGRPHHPPQTSCIQRATTFLRCIHRQPCPNPLLLHISKLHIPADSLPEAKMTF